MFDKIKNEVNIENIENMPDDWQIQFVLGVGWKEKGKEIRKIICQYIKKAYEIRNKYIK